MYSQFRPGSEARQRHLPASNGSRAGECQPPSRRYLVLSTDTHAADAVCELKHPAIICEIIPFFPKDASSMKASKETAILLLFISNASYTDIEYIHIGLVVVRWGYKVGDQASIVLYISFIQNQLVEMCVRAQTRKSSLPQPHSFCLFMEDYKSMMAPPMEPLYCLVYPIRFFNNMPADLRNQLHTDLFPPGLCCQECVCHWLIQWANLHEKWETIMGSSRFLLPRGAQYDDNPLPWLIRPQNHRSLLMDPIMAQPYPLVEVGSFMMQDPLFPGTAGSKSKRCSWTTPTALGQLPPLSGTEAHLSEALLQPPSMHPNSPPHPGRQ